ncbi:C40 family peptidase [Mycolicibacterium lacusdiani]|uniref:C40 family peptidase n=1 Tax=Mycolicibacterium lacusdiani TaxID=2895283 RepID=UPI003556A6C0
MVLTASSPQQLIDELSVQWVVSIETASRMKGSQLPQVAALGQALAVGGQPVTEADLQPGDIVTFYSDVSHAGIYIGDGMMVHASTFGTPVKVAPISSSPFYNARRY